MAKFSFDGFLRTLRARHIDRVAVGYAVVAWLAVQAASISLSSFNAPAWALRAIIIFALIGFPVALVLAWLAAPHLFPEDPQVRRLRPAHALLGVFAMVVILVAADLAYMLSGLSLLSSPQSSAPTAGFNPARNSIAVLPFVNMMGDPSKDWFSDGISEELLNDLANVPSLLVVARTSSFAFKGKNEDVRQIAKILDVHSILEGSVRASGNHLRITAQLIDATTDFHVWSETYDRNLSDVLAVQDDIARAITAALTNRLMPRARERGLGAVVAINGEAYQKYLLAKHELGPRTAAGSQAALALFRRVTELAPDFAGGFAGLARAEINVAEYRPEPADLIAGAHAALQRAFALAPDNIDALSTHLDLALHELDWKSAIDDAKKMKKINPGSEAVLHELFRFYQFLGFPDLAREAAMGAAKLDPLSFVDKYNIAAALLHEGRFAEAARAAKAALALAPTQPLAKSVLCTASARIGDIGGAKRLQDDLAKVHDSGAENCLMQIDLAEHRFDDASAVADKIAKAFGQNELTATEIAEDYAECRQFDEANDWLERADQSQEYLLVLFAYESVIPREFFETARWKTLSTRSLLANWHDAHDEVAAQLAAQ